MQPHMPLYFVLHYTPWLCKVLQDRGSKLCTAFTGEHDIPGEYNSSAGDQTKSATSP